MAKVPDPSSNQFWQQHALNQPTEQLFTLGDTEFKVRLDDQEILVALVNQHDSKDCTWQRWQQPFKDPGILFTPIVPNRPLSVKLESPLTLTHSENLTVYIQIPVWIRVQLVSGSHNINLLDIPTTTLSGTWFGSMTEGQLCYSLGSNAHSSLTMLKDHSNLANCQLVMKNASKENFIIDRILLRTEYLTLYLFETRIWTDTALFTVYGKGKDNQLRFSGKAPEFVKSAKLISKPNQTLKKPLTEMIFANVRDLADAGSYAMEKL